MIEITIRLKPSCAHRFAALLRTTALTEPDRGQARAYRGAARRIERTPGLRRPAPTKRPAPVKAPAAPRPHRYTPRAQRPHHRGIDERAVQRVVLGLRPLPVLSRAEARLACWHLTQHEAPASEIAERIHVAKRTVHRWRAEDRKAVTTR
ncbi:hypothetical protein [Streptomyces sp. NPDC057257]|uniref:hypothetical protein n=1 Tax=Streptomyces sp. NPDC057257 TaxID=3346071 RepID=UPI003642245C